MVLVELIFQHIYSTLDALVNQTVLFGCGALAFRIVDNACNRIHIAVIQNIVTVNLIFQFAELGNCSGVGQYCSSIERRKCIFHFLCVVHKVHDHDLLSKGGHIRFKRESVCTAFTPRSFFSTYMAQSFGWSKPT